MESKITLWADDVIGGLSSVLIIKKETGVIYKVQAGGMSVTHLGCEGFVINVGVLGQDFDDCSYGCEYIKGDNIKQGELAKGLAMYLKARTSDWSYSIDFDYDRISELQEGWWPVTLIGKFSEIDVNWKGYLHTGNCD